MRKITQDVCAAFMSRTPRSISNTTTDGTALYLHGNKIAEWRDEGIAIYLNGMGDIESVQRAIRRYLSRRLLATNPV